MKQTNNAITFLAASYRAVFNKAYIKGFASTCALLAISSPYAIASVDVMPLADDTGTTDSGSTATVTGSWAQEIQYATDITVTGGYTDNKSSFSDIYANNFTVEGESGSAVVTATRVHLGQFLVNAGYAKFDTSNSIYIANKLEVTGSGSVVINASYGDVDISGQLKSEGTAKITASSGSIIIGGIETNGDSEFNAHNLTINGPISLNGVSDFNIRSTATINGPLNVAGQTTISAYKTSIDGNVVVDGSSSTDLEPNFNPGITFDNGVNSTAALTYISGDIKVDNAEFNVSNNKLFGQENTSKPIASEFEANTAEIEIANGSVHVNKAGIEDSNINIGGLIGGNTSLADIDVNYANLYTGKGATNGDALLTRTNVDISDKGVLGSDKLIALSDGSTITFHGSKDDNLERAKGEIAAKALLKAQTAALFSGSTASVANNATGGILAQNFTLAGLGSRINVGQDAELYISGRNTTNLNEGATGGYTPINYEDGNFIFDSGATIDNSGSIILGALASTTVQSGSGYVVQSLTPSKYRFTQKDGTLNNAGTLEIGATPDSGEANLVTITKPSAYEEAPGTTYIGLSGSLNNASGAEINVNQGSSFLLQGTDLNNLGTINVQSGAEFSITAGSKLTGNSSGSINIASGGSVTVRIDALESYAHNPSTSDSGTYIDTGNISSLGEFKNSGTITLDKVTDTKAVYIATQNDLTQALGVQFAPVDTSLGVRVVLAANTHLRIDESTLDESTKSINLSDNFLTQFSGGTESSIQVDGTINYTAASQETVASGSTADLTDDFNGLSLVAKNINFTSSESNNTGNIQISGSTTSKPIFVATNSVTTNGFTTNEKKGLVFTNAELHLDSLALDLGTGSSTPSTQNTEELKGVNVDLTFDNGGKFSVDDSSWSAKNITFKSGSAFEINGSLNKLINTPKEDGTYISLADAAQQQGLTISGTISLESGSTASLNNASLTAQKLLTKGVFEAAGSYIKVNGDGSNTTVDFNGGSNTKLKNSAIDLGQGADTVGLAFDTTTNSFVLSSGTTDYTYQKFQGEAVEIYLDLSGSISSGSSVKVDQINGLFNQLVTSGSSGLLHLTGNVDVDFSDKVDSGSGQWEIDFGDIAPSGDLSMNFDTEITRDSVLVGINNQVTGGWKAVELASGEAGPVEIKENGTLGLYGATSEGNLAQDANGKVTGINLNSGSTLMIHSQGKIGDITGESGSLLALGSAANITVQDASGNKANIDVDKLMSAGSLNANSVTANTAEFTQGSNFTVANIDIKNDLSATGTNIQADNMTVGTANFNGSQLQINQNFNSSGSLIFDNASDIDIDGTLTAAGGLKLVGNSILNAGRIIANGDIQVGAEAGIETESSSAHIVAEQIDLGNGNSLILDPEFGLATATVFAQNIGQIASGSTSGETVTQSSVMNLNGNIIVGRNSALGLGGDQADFINALSQQQVNGSLTPDGTGAYLYVNRANIQLNDNRLIIGADDIESLKAKLSGTASIHFGEGATMQITTKALNEVGTDSSVFTGLDASKSISSTDGKLIVPAALTTEEISKLFGKEVELESGSKIVITTENGLYTGVIDDSSDLHGDGDINLDISDDARQILANLSQPTFDFVTKVLSNETTHYASEEDYLNGSSSGTGGDSGTDTSGSDTSGSDTSGSGSTESDTSGASIMLAAAGATGNGISVIDNSTGYNFIRDAVGSVNSLAIEQSARLANLGGIMQTAMKASQVTTNAINGRLGNGHDNGQYGLLPPGKMGRIWATPIYNNYSSDNFSADGIGYGNDINMYGAIMGAELSIARGVTTGASFSIGTGSSNGNGNAAGINNDFNFYSLGAYANLHMTKQWDILADFSYTNISNEFDATTGVAGYNKLEASTDAEVWSLGVTAQYKYRTHNNIMVMPHAGLRYENVQFDGYDTKVDSTYLNHTSSGEADVISIPLGVSVYKDMRAGKWLMRPSADIQVIANLGDKDVSTNTNFDGIYGEGISYSTEFVDPLVYSANFGITFSQQHMSIGASVGYQGSSNTNEFSFGLNGKYRF